MGSWYSVFCHVLTHQLVDQRKKLGPEIDLTDLTLRLSAEPDGQQYRMTLTVTDANGKPIGDLSARVESEALVGNVALVSHHLQDGYLLKRTTRTPGGRFSDKTSSMWFAVTRKRLPTWGVQFVAFSVDFRTSRVLISVPLLKERSSPLAGREFSGSLAKCEVGWEPRPSVANKPNDLAGKRRGFRARSTP